MTVTCPGCKRKLNVSDGAVGKTIICPACKGQVVVEESLELMPEVDVSTPVVSVGPAIGAAGRTCPSCGIPVPPRDILCRRCGTDLATGARDRSFIGYQAGSLRKLLARSGWILTLVVTAAIGIGIYIGVMKARKYAKSFREEDPADAEAEAAGRRRGKKRPGRVASPAPAEKPKPREEEVALPAPPSEPDEPAPRDPEEERKERFEKAVVFLTSKKSRESRRGLQQILNLGAHAVPLVLEKLQEAEDLPVCLALVEVLGQMRRPEATNALVDLLSDPDHHVRAAAVRCLVSQGDLVSGVMAKALAADSPRTKTGAIQVVASLRLKALAPQVMRLLGNRAAEVRQEAARALGGPLGGKEAVKLLISRLDDANMDVAAAASEALGSRPEALPLVMAELDKREFGTDEAQANRLFLLAGPILASGNAAAAGKLAERACADRPIPKVIERAKTILASSRAITRAGALGKARGSGDSKPPMPLIATLCLADPDVRIKTAALEYLSDFPTPGVPMPLVVTMGHKNLELAMSAARELAKLPGSVARDALRRTAKGVHVRRRLLAAGELARRKDPTGVEVLASAATGEIEIPSPLPGWAAYRYSFVGEKDRAEEFAAAAEATRSMIERAFYYAAAARLGDAGSRAKLGSMLSTRRTPPIVRLAVARLLGELGVGGSKKVLLEMLRETDARLQMAAIEALEDIRDPSIIPALIANVPGLVPSAATAARGAILSYGAEAEKQLQSALSKGDRHMWPGALETLAELGRKASKTSVAAVVGVMQKGGRDRTIQRLAAAALRAMTGVEGKSDWEWGDWARALNINIKAASLSLVQRTWGWLSLHVPEHWSVEGWGAGDPGAPGKPQIKVTLKSDEYRDPIPGGRRMWKPLYTGAEDMRKKRKRELAQVAVGNQYAPRPGLVAVDKPVFAAGGARVAPMLLVDKKAGLTTYWLFAVKKEGSKAYWTVGAALSAETKQYNRYRGLFEGRIARSIAFTTSKAGKVVAGPPPVTAPGGPQTWEWVTFTTPPGWRRGTEGLSHATATGSPTITVSTERDPFDPELKLPMSKRRYRSAKAMCSERAIEMSTRRIGNQHVPLPNVKARICSTFRVGKANVSPLRISNTETGRTVYWIFVALIEKDTNWYAEIKCSVPIKQYADHKQFFESGIRKSLKLDFDMMR